LAFGVNDFDTTGYIQLFTNPAEAAKQEVKKPDAKDSGGCSLSPARSGTDLAPLWLLGLLAAVRRRRP
jgi:MYXO-CTERM domain-containing protein